jgi:hypothetical protein
VTDASEGMTGDSTRHFLPHESAVERQACSMPDADEHQPVTLDDNEGRLALLRLSGNSESPPDGAFRPVHANRSPRLCPHILSPLGLSSLGPLQTLFVATFRKLDNCPPFWSPLLYGAGRSQEYAAWNPLVGTPQFEPG